MITLIELEQLLGLEELGLGARLVVPYGEVQDGKIVYRASYRSWCGSFEINYHYHSAEQTITLTDHDSERTIHPIVFLNDRYRKKLVAVFEVGDKFFRVDVIRDQIARHIDVQSAVFLISEHEEPVHFYGG